MFKLGAQHAGRDRLRPGAFELSAGLRHVRRRDDAGGVLVLTYAQRLGIGACRRVEQPFQLIRAAQLHVIGGELALRRQPRAGDISGAGLSTRDIAFDSAPDLAPQIRDPARRLADAEEIRDPASTARAGARRLCVDCRARKEAGAKTAAGEQIH